MKTRSSRDIKAVMLRIKERTDNQIKIMTTDGWMAYEKTIKKVFGYSLKEVSLIYSIIELLFLISKENLTTLLKDCITMQDKEQK